MTDQLRTAVREDVLLGDLSSELKGIEAKIHISLLMLESLAQGVELKPIVRAALAEKERLGSVPTAYFYDELLDQAIGMLRNTAVRIEKLGDEKRTLESNL